MKLGTRTAMYDRLLRIEAYCFDGIVQPFPAHVHEFYVFGLIERGSRRLVCAGSEHAVSPGNTLVFNPGDSHSCTQEEGVLLYRALNIPRDIVLDHLGYLPRFTGNVLSDVRLFPAVRTLYASIESGAPGRERQLEELLKYAAGKYGAALERAAYRDEVARAREYIKANYSAKVSLDALSAEAGLSKSALLRAFEKATGVTPYLYLESVRVGAARLLLERGASPDEAALMCGFSEQSHLTNCFGRLLGLTPGAYRKIYTQDGD